MRFARSKFECHKLLHNLRNSTAESASSLLVRSLRLLRLLSVAVDCCSICRRTVDDKTRLEKRRTAAANSKTQFASSMRIVAQLAAQHKSELASLKYRSFRCLRTQRNENFRFSERCIDGSKSRASLVVGLGRQASCCATQPQ